MYTTHPRYPTPAEGPPSPPLRGVMSEAVAQANRGRVRPKLKLGVIAAVAALALALPSIASATNNWQIKSIEGHQTPIGVWTTPIGGCHRARRCNSGSV
jgi:hypothetical protein